MDSNSSESNKKIPSGLIDKLQFGVDDDQPMVETSDVEKSLSSEAYAEQSIENNSVRFPTRRDEQREGSKSTPTLKSPAGAAEGEVAPTTDDSSKQSTSTSPIVPDGGGRGGESSDNEKARRSSLENKTTLKPSSSVGTSLVNLVNEATGAKANDSSSMMMDEAWERLRLSFAYSQNKPVGTLAIVDPSAEALNYNQVFVRDCVPTALACLMRVPDPEPEIVKRLLLNTLHLQGWKKPFDNFTHGEGVVHGGVTPVDSMDSGFWWIILLWSYTKRTGDSNLLEKPEVQKEMKLILKLCLSDEFDTSPTLLCADGCSMIDRRMGIHGYPIEIQALFFFALRCVQEMLEQDTDSNGLLLEQIKRRITALSYHIRKYYWLDFTKLNNIYRNKTEEYSHTTLNEFNVIPESIPEWVFDFMPSRGGYFIGNVTPKHMDFRWFLMGNCIAILSSLATLAQTADIMDLVEERWEDLIGEMPLKIVYPALEGDEWRIVTGCDHKNTSWSYQNAGSWPVLLWLLTAACIKAGRPQIAKMAIELVEQRLSKDGWPEYYDGKKGRYVGKQARKYQTPSISGYLVAKLMIENPSNLAMISLEEEKKIESDMPYTTSIDLQMEILKLLPVKTLVGFLSVSKDFKSIIKCPRFIAVQTRLRHTRPQHLLAMNSDPIDGVTHCICFVDNEAFPGDRYIPSTPPSPPLDFPIYRKNIIGSSHGIIALGGGSKTVTLWNPSIRRTISVFVPDTPDTTCVTFGVCPITLEVKVITISWREKIAMVYTLSTRQWRNTTIGLPPTPTTDKHRSIVPTSVVTDRFCYWQAFLNCNHTIIAFDLTNEIFEELLLPTSLARGGFKTCKIDGSLGMTQFQQQENVVQVWKLEHNVDIAISMLYTLETPNLLVGFPRNGGHILIEEDGEEELLVYHSGSNSTGESNSDEFYTLVSLQSMFFCRISPLD